jgi:Fe-S-cluster-containing hydrogenase component 2/bacterioferritin-associated ferredoxin
MQVACELGMCAEQVPEDWLAKAGVLKSPGGRVFPWRAPDTGDRVFPVIHCFQEIPCNPCMTSCPRNLIVSAGHPILGLPEYTGGCIGCEKCVAVCPGLAITLVDRRKSVGRPVVTVPFELDASLLRVGDSMELADWEGAPLGEGVLREVRQVPGGRRTTLLRIEVPAEAAVRVAGVRIQDRASVRHRAEALPPPLADDAVVCRCERVTAGEIRKLLRSGVTDLNELKALTRAGFGACGGKTCRSLLDRLCREEGIDPGSVTPLTERPLFAETRLGCFSGRSGE